MDKKVGIVSCYFKHNYGSVLQAYATKKILDIYHIENETINIDKNIDFKNGKRTYYLKQLFNFNFLKTKFGMLKLKLDKKVVKNLAANISIREQKYDEFKDEFNFSSKCKTYDELSKMVLNTYSDIVLGSDQLWLPVNVAANYYTLNWVPKNINKISYSTSFGIAKIPERYEVKYVSFLKRIEHISVREETGVRIVEQLGMKAHLICDPTMLLTKEQWHKETVKERIIKDKYILCYFLGTNIEHRKFVERLKKETGYVIVSLNHADEYVKYSDSFADIMPYDVGPREWLNLIEYAEYVCTDSFHAIAFSGIFNKMFFCFRRYNEKNKMSTNTRLYSLLNMLGIHHERILDGTEEIKDVIQYKIDYSLVNEQLNKVRKQSIEWLLHALGIDGGDHFAKQS